MQVKHPSSTFSHFSGRVIQVIEALDEFDACSSHVMQISNVFQENFGLKCEIYSAHVSENMKDMARNISSLVTDERDILLYHYSGFATHTADQVVKQKAVKVFHYHNITEKEFFQEGSPLYLLCSKGREQLKNIIRQFDFYTADSQYNLDELISLGISIERCTVLPIQVRYDFSNTVNQEKENCSNILFVGRIVENKRQDRLIEIYAKLLGLGFKVGKLLLVGGYDAKAPFYNKIVSLIRELKLEDQVIITGKVSHKELDLIYKNAGLFVSMSEHEGFGVPLLEACKYGLPVLALAKAAVPETLQNSPGLFKDDDGLIDLIDRLLSSTEFKSRLLNHQDEVLRQNDQKLNNKLNKFLTSCIPLSDTYKTISIVICTYNRGTLLDRALDYLQHQHDPRFEVIVVDGPSTDDTPEIVKKWQDQIKFVKNPARNLSISRNLGIKMASGDIVAFIDDDALPFGDWVGTLLQEFNSVPYLIGGVGGVTYYAGSLEFQADDIVTDSYGRGTLNPSHEELLRPDRFRTLLGTNAAFKREVLLRIGGFDEEYDYFLDESDVCMRVIRSGMRLLHSRNLFLRHEFAQSANRESKYRYNWYSICKNTAYFSFRFNSGSKSEILAKINHDIEQDRIAHIKQGLQTGEINNQQFEEMSAEIWSGVDAGIEHAAQERKLLTVNVSPPAFLPYLTKAKEFKPLHVVIVTKEFPPFTTSGGVGTLYYNLASELLLMGHRVSVIAQSAENSVYKRGRFTLYRNSPNQLINFQTASVIAERNLNWSLQVAKKILEIDHKEPISVIDSCIWDSELYAYISYRTQYCIPTVIRLVTPFAVAAESNNWEISESEKSLVMETERELVNSVDMVIPISRSIEKTFLNRYGVTQDKRWHRIPAGISYWPLYDVNQGYASLDGVSCVSQAKEANKFIFLFLGRLEERKGVDVLLEAIQLFFERNLGRDDVLFVLAGKDCMGLEQKLDRYIGKVAKANVSFTGEFSLWARDKLYSAADAVIFPSRYESFGLVPLEAFVHSKPVIGSDAGAIPEVVEDNVSGVLFEDGKPDSLVLAIEKVINSRDLYEKLVLGAKNRIRELSSLNMALESESLYKTLILNFDKEAGK